MLKGIFPVLPTCFSSEGALDLTEQRKVIQFAINSGAHGIVFPGVASEYDYLTRKERNTLIELLAQEVGQKVPIVAGVSAPEVKEVIALMEDAGQHDISYFMLMAPAHLGSDLAKQKNYFARITNAFPTANIILQNAPEPIGAGLTAKQLIEIIAENPCITYIKEETIPSGPTISALQNESISHLLGVFGGGGARYIIDELHRGAVGAVPAVELIDLHVALFEAFQSGRIARARQLYRLSLPMLTAQKVYRMGLTKYVLQKRGVCNALSVRAPSIPLDEYARQDIDEMLDDLKQAEALG